ncbi:MAG: hypothetical protein ACJ0G4_04030 [Alphaproteobacteria bacterium]
MSINVCIFGVSGYTGSKLLYYLDKHPNVNVAGALGDSSAGKTSRRGLSKSSKLFRHQNYRL